MSFSKAASRWAVALKAAPTVISLLHASVPIHFPCSAVSHAEYPVLYIDMPSDVMLTGKETVPVATCTGSIMAYLVTGELCSKDMRVATLLADSTCPAPVKNSRQLDAIASCQVDTLPIHWEDIRCASSSITCSLKYSLSQGPSVSSKSLGNCL
ncbi:hypothetical protein CcaCcLH18_04723 [Colletotrichum camelliae]|nr:hypothetical protein CcaCcLH18_04723 [Colletotrichum camelliae]